MFAMTHGENDYPEVILTGLAGKIFNLTLPETMAKVDAAEARILKEIELAAIDIARATKDSLAKAMEAQDLALFQLYSMQRATIDVHINVDSGQTLTAAARAAIEATRAKVFESITNQIKAIEDSTRREEFATSAIVDLILDTFDSRAQDLLKTTAVRDLLHQRRLENVRGTYSARSKVQPTEKLAVHMTQRSPRRQKWYFFEVKGDAIEQLILKSPRTSADVRSLPSQGFDVMELPLQELLPPDAMLETAVMHHFEDPVLALLDAQLHSHEL